MDVRAVLGATGDDHPRLVGHSFGGLCALEAARSEPGPATLTVYEPPLRGDRVMDAARRPIELIHAGRPEDAALVFLPEEAGLSEYLTHDEFTEGVPNAELTVIDGQRHLALVAEPQAVAAAVMDFTRPHR